MRNRAGKLIRISVAGGFRLLDEAGREIRLPLIRSKATIAYLAFSDTASANRGKLAGMFWSEKDNSNALQSFRQVALQLKTISTEHAAGFLDINNQSISLDRSMFTCELDILTEPVSNSNPPDFSLIPEPSTLLEGLDGFDSVFDEWLRSWREETAQKLRATLTKTITSNDIDEEIRTNAAEALARIEPASETAARHLIDIEYRKKDSAAMLRVYQRLWDALAEDWGEEPSADLQDFFVEKRMALGEVAKKDTAHNSDNEVPAKGKRELLSVIVVRISPVVNSTLIDIEEVESQTRQRTELVEAILEKHGGAKHNHLNGEVIGVFGALSTAEEDIQIALNAALEINASLDSESQNSSNGLRFNHRIGIDTGTVYLRISGDGKNLSDVFGTPVSRTIELSRRAEGETVLATAQSVRRLQATYSLLDAPPLASNGETVEIKGVLGKQHPSFHLSGEAWHSKDTFVGRDAVMSALEEQWIATQQKQLQRAAVIGEPGVGKTRLVSEFLRKKVSAKESIHFVRCSRQDRSAPLEPMLALHTSLNGAGSSPSASGLEARLLNALADKQAILVFDDWQWADDASRAMLGKLISECRDQAIMLIFTIRGTHIADENLSDIEPHLIESMDISEVLQTAEKLLGWVPEERIRQHIYTKSGGNPFFIEEICHALLKHTVEDLDNLNSDNLPGDMHSMMVSRYEDLAPSLQGIMEVAATYGDGLSVELLKTALDAEVEEKDLQELVELGLLSARAEGAPLYFKHGITFDILYNRISLAKRRTLHARFAEILEAQAGPDGVKEIAETLAFHFKGAGEYNKAVTHAIRAGDKALSLSSLDRAKAQYGMALDLIDQCEQTVENKMRWLTTAMRWGLPCIYAPARDQVPVLQRAVRLAREFNDKTAMAVVNHWIGYIQLVIGDHAGSIKHLTIAEELTHVSGNQRLETDIIATRGFTHAGKCDYVRARRDIESALKRREQNPGSGGSVPVLSSYAKASLAVVEADQGNFPKSHQLINDALDRVKPFNHEIESSICNLGSAIMLWQGRWAEALDLADRSCRRSEIVNSPYLINMARCLQAYAHWRETGSGSKLSALKSAADRLWTSEMRFYISFCYGWLSDACAMLEQKDDAYNAAERTLELAQYGDPIGAPMACRTLAILTACETGLDPERQLDKALIYLDQADTHSSQRKSPHEQCVTELHRARLHAAYGETEIALARIGEATTTLENLEMHWHLSRAREMQNLLRDDSFLEEPSRFTRFLL